MKALRIVRPTGPGWLAVPGKYRAAGVGLALLLATPGWGQQLTNAGQTLFVGPGATLRVGGGYAQTGAAQLVTAGTTRVEGAVQAAAGTTLELRGGELQATGDVISAGTTISTPTGTLRLNGTTPQTLDARGSTVGQLVLDKPAAAPRVDLPTDLTVTGGLTLTGGLLRTAATSTLTLADGATLTGEAPGNYVQGNLRAIRAAVGGTSPVVFPNSVTINPNGNALGSVTITRAAGLGNSTSSAANPGGSATSSIDRIWTIVPQAQPAAGTPATLTLSWLDDDDGGLSTPARRASAQAFRRPDGASAFAPLGPAQDASGRSLSVTAAAFSDWTVSAAVAPLPVTLVAFTATAAGGGVWLRWTTASELNSAYFEVQSSTDGQQFGPVGRVAAGGTQAQSYQLLDPDLARYAAPLVYYRLRQVDLDGTAHYSPVRTLAVAGGPWLATLAPNPAGPGQPVMLRLPLPDAAPVQVQVQVREATGRLLSQRTVPAAASLPLPELAALPPGLYLVQVAQGAQHGTLRVVRQ